MTEVGGSSDVESFDFIRGVITNTTGLVIPASRDEELQQSIFERMQESASSTLMGYGRLVSCDEKELYQLVTLLTINESYFYRDKRQLKEVMKSLSQWSTLANGEARPIRLLSAGCARGEEPYSLLIAADHLLGTEMVQQMVVDGTDIDQGILDCAKNGHYGAYAFRGWEGDWEGTPLGTLQEHYFEKVDGRRFQVINRIKKRVDFFFSNLLQGIDRKPGHYDLILYNNVSLYFKKPDRRTILKNLLKLLRPGGRLLMTPVEIMQHTQFLEPEDGVFLKSVQGYGYLQKADANNQPVVREVRRFIKKPTVKTVALANPVNTQMKGVKQAQRYLVEEKYEAALKALGGSPYNTTTGDQGSWIALNALYLMSRMGPARALAQQILGQNNSDTLALIILGLICRGENKLQEWVSWHRQATYSRANCWLPYYYLGEVYQQLKLPDQATLQYEQAARIVESQGLGSHGLLYWPMFYNSEQFLTLCRFKAGRGVDHGN
jgi:chemotaxis protein methyltransferase CheR